MIVIVSGPPGSGKTTLAKKISEKYNYEYVSTGAIFREMARALNVDVVTLNKMAEKELDIDIKVDSKVLDFLKRDKIVIESHIAGWGIKGSKDDVVAIYVTASLEKRAQRIASRDGISYEQAVLQVLSREESHWRRFFNFYGINITDLSIFDLVVNTDNLTPDEVFAVVDGYLKSFSKHRLL